MLQEYFGQECPHCISMMPLVERLEKELGVTVEKYEVWHSDTNKEKVKGIEEFKSCGGVPFFINTETRKTICGDSTYEELRAWAEGK